MVNIKDEDHIGKSDPYVKFEVEQDNALFDKDMGEMKSTGVKSSGKVVGPSRVLSAVGMFKSG